MVLAAELVVRTASMIALRPAEVVVAASAAGKL
jgi:hypothetical protein